MFIRKGKGAISNDAQNTTGMIPTTDHRVAKWEEFFRA